MMYFLYILFFLGSAIAEEPPVPETPPKEDAVATDEPLPIDDPLKWSAMVLAFPSGDSVNGVGFGAGGQIFARPASQEQGYRFSLMLSLYVNLRFDYTHNFVRLESSGPINWLGIFGYSGWKNLVYAGVGGQNAYLRRPELEAGNIVATPFATLAATAPMGSEGWSIYGQGSLRYSHASAAPGSLLEEDAPLGLDNSFYADISVGATLDTTDQWPLPHTGWQGEAGVRAGLTASAQRLYPMGSIQAQVIRWQPLWKKHLVLGIRILGERDFGQRPFFEQDRAGVRWRDVFGEDQLLLGYGKNRPRGDGLFAAALEMRLQFAHHHGKFWDLQTYVSLFAEEAWLLQGSNPGPHLPTVGIAPVILFQHAIVLRPFFAWGWRADTVDDTRRPVAQFGLSLMDPL